jgi:colanic acid biosynthesis glycosyl transferase WcaI
LPRIIIATQVFPPEIHPSAIMVRELAEHLAAKGWEVTVCAGLPHHPQGKLYDGYRWRGWQKEHEGGVEIIRVGHFIHPSRAIPTRSLVFGTQALAEAAGALAQRRRADVVLVYGPPLLGAALGAIAAKRHRAKLVNVIYDIYPDVAIETGKVNNSLVIKAARWAEKLQYRVSDMTIVLSEGFKKTLIEKGVPSEKIAVIPVWLDPEEIRPMSRDNAWRHEQGIPLDKFVVLYAGTIGVVSGATVVAEAAALLSDRNDILFLFVGEGEEKPKVQARAKELGLTNMKFLPFQPRERLAEVQATADVGLVTLAPGRGRTSVPSKVLGYMAAGRPVIASVDEDSDTAREISDTEIGAVVPPGCAEPLAEAISMYKRSTGKRLGHGESARSRLKVHFARQSVLERYERVLARVASNGGAP